MAARTVRERSFGTRPAIFRTPRATIPAFFFAGFLFEDRAALAGGAAAAARIGPDRAGEWIVRTPAKPLLVGPLVGRRPWLILWAFVFHGAPRENPKTSTM